LEKDLKAKHQAEWYPGRHYKKRRHAELSSTEIMDIVHSYLVDHQYQEEIARHHGVTLKLVSKLVCQARKEPEKLRERKQKEKAREEMNSMIEATTSEMLNSNMTITSIDQVKKKIKQEHEVELSTNAVQKVMKQSMGLSYRRVRKVPVQANSERCLVLRQQYAMVMLSMLDAKTRVLNIDETWLNETNFVRKAWFKAGTPGTMSTKPITPRLSMITALDTDGRVYFSLSHATTDQDTYMLFLRHLIVKLDLESPGWQENSLFLMDNAPYHVSEQARGHLRKMQVPVMFSGPYSYSAAPIETLFSLLKLGELNKTHVSTGKKVSPFSPTS